MKKSQELINDEKRKRNEKISNKYKLNHPFFNIISKNGPGYFTIPAFFFFGIIELFLTDTYGLFTLITTALTYYLANYIYKEGIKELKKLENE
ncbi:hypothetical protein N9V85_00855 [Candidatus Pelagibacter bacterium]|nr:hypothetical protein [Candidatus Pelagibacter bacterium]